MHLLIVSLLVAYARAQQDACSCACCIGQSCTPVLIGNFSMPYCTAQMCGDYCRSASPLCQVEYPNGQLLALCSYSREPLFNCQCDCCRTGSAQCTPGFVGYSTAFLCQTGACSLSCIERYPVQCVSNENGQTNGTCIGPITTTTTTSTTSTAIATASTGGRQCSCMCCPSGPNCIPDISVGYASVATCSLATCTQACQNQFSAYCPTDANLGRVNGTCSNPTTGNHGRSFEFGPTLLLFFITTVFNYE